MNRLTKYIWLAPLLCAAPLSQASPCAQGGQGTVVLKRGDTIPGLGTVSSTLFVDVNDHGEWISLVTLMGTTVECLVRNGDVVLQTGDALTGGNGATVRFLDYTPINDSGEICPVCRLSDSPGDQDEAVVINQAIGLRRGFPVRSLDVPTGSTYERFWCARLSNAGHLAVVVDYFDPEIPSSVQRGVFVHEVVQGTVLDSFASWKVGDVLPGQTQPLASIGNNHNRFALNDHGSLIFSATVAGIGDTVFVDGVEVAKTGSPSPSPGLNWSGFFEAVDINNAGIYTVRGSAGISGQTEEVLSLNGELDQETGAGFPAIAPYVLRSMGSGSSQVTETGSLVWFGRWTGPDAIRDEAIFVNQEAVIEEGLSVVDGMLVRFLFSDSFSYSGSNNGRWILARVVNSQFEEMLVLMDRSLGSPYCSPVVSNSTGLPGEIFAVGSTSVTANDLNLIAAQLPMNAFGFFITSRMQGFTANPAGSQGNLCLGDAIGRYVGPGQIQYSGELGQISLALDLTQMPQPLGSVGATAGDTWNFQAWHRDSVMGMGTSNLTNGVEVVLTQ